MLCLNALISKSLCIEIKYVFRTFYIGPIRFNSKYITTDKTIIEKQFIPLILQNGNTKLAGKDLPV